MSKDLSSIIKTENPDNVHVVEVDRGAIRAYFDGDFDFEDIEGFDTTLDTAQGQADAPDKTSYVVIKINGSNL